MNRQSRRSDQERAQTERLENFYALAQTPEMHAVERRACGCDYGGCSWTTADEAAHIADMLQLAPGRRLLDIGAGAGWPGLYMAKLRQCDVVLTDLPFTGLRIARERARVDRLAGACWAVVADGAAMPFVPHSFDAVSHSDVLCCLAQKRAVLQACRSLVADAGAMAFSVIYAPPDLSAAAQRRAEECGPEFVATDTDYPTLLAQTGWLVRAVEDVSDAFARSCERTLAAEADNREALRELLGPDRHAERRAGIEGRLSGVVEGVLRRAIFFAMPAPAAAGC